MAVCILVASTHSMASPPFGHDGTPGIHRTGLALPMSSTLATGALQLGYGYTESLWAGDAGHHRQSARVALSMWPIPWIGANFRFDQRCDVHPNDGTGSDSGCLIEPTFGLKGAFGLTETLFFGLDVSLWLPGTSGIGTSFESAALDTRLLASTTLSRMVAGVALGYRFDRSAQAGRDVMQMRPGDRIALGLSQHDALLVGVGLAYSLGIVTLKGEVSASPLVGGNAPPIWQSPLRIAAGIEHALTGAILLDAVIEGALNSRPEDPTLQPSVPIEPRVCAWLGIRHEMPRQRAPAHDPSSVQPAPPPSAMASVREAIPTTPLRIRLQSDEGDPIPDAQVSLEIDGRTYALMPLTQGEYGLEAAPLGKGILRAQAGTIVPLERSIEVGSEPSLLELRAPSTLPSAQVRGLVRSLDGKPLPATVRIEPSSAETSTDGTGRFEVTVQPGTYYVVIKAPGFSMQRRQVKVKKGGVVVINADLTRVRR